MKIHKLLNAKLKIKNTNGELYLKKHSSYILKFLKDYFNHQGYGPFDNANLNLLKSPQTNLDKIPLQKKTPSLKFNYWRISDTNVEEITSLFITNTVKGPSMNEQDTEWILV